MLPVEIKFKASDYGFEMVKLPSNYESTKSLGNQGQDCRLWA